MIIRFYLFLILVSLFSTSCSTIATGGAEVTGLALLHDRRNSDVLFSDEKIEISAGIELNSHDDTRNLCHFNVTAYNGTVLVTGEAPTQQLRDKIINIVRKIPNVKRVYNELRLAKPSSLRSRAKDTLLTTKVKSALSNIKNLPGFDATRVKVITENGVVFLLGLVHKNEALVATEIARRIDGVKQVVKVFEYIEY